MLSVHVKTTLNHLPIINLIEHVSKLVGLVVGQPIEHSDRLIRRLRINKPFEFNCMYSVAFMQTIEPNLLYHCAVLACSIRVSNKPNKLIICIFVNCVSRYFLQCKCPISHANLKTCRTKILRKLWWFKSYNQCIFLVWSWLIGNTVQTKKNILAIQVYCQVVNIWVALRINSFCYVK